MLTNMLRFLPVYFQFKKLSVAVELGGGTPMLLEEGTDDNEDDILVSPGSCVMSCDLTDHSQNLTKNAQDWIQHVMKTLKKLVNHFKTLNV